MKIKRQKQAKKTLSFYKYNFNFREPHQILIDGTFCQAALKNKIQIKEQMPKYLMGEVQLCTTNCALKELDTLEKELYGAKLILQRYQVRKCQHFKNPVPASQCLLSMLEDTNPHHYFVATQDFKLTTGLKKIPGVPLLYIILNTMVLEKPSQSSLDQVQAAQLGGLMSPAQQQRLCSMKEDQGIAQKGGERRGKKRKRKQHNPNPLSCLKKKKKKSGPTPPLKKTEQAHKRTRSRHKKRATPGEDHVSTSSVQKPSNRLE
ncbi:rRNA-processing protein UTP23 homolog [Phyllopteryx taeniolatus]|uniref:rRNA-processing protein UTP23 homolog n=1 Tax=Phyllopteryx taeniolatus TaxID=161469 RepID=UPI002AD5604C|nr:rRNA-processing protein UTP23 homolog [Phyllopteryx taeniolatus]